MSTEKPKILFVDDELNILNAYKRQLRSKYQVEIAISAHEGLSLLAQRGPFSVIVSDMQMAEVNGIEFLQLVKEKAPETVRIMLTGKLNEGVAVQAVNKSNIFRFLNKPCSADELELAIDDAISQYQLITAERDLLQNTLSGSVKLLTDILSLMGPTSFGSTLDLREPVRQLSMELGAKNIWAIELAVMLGDLGMIMLPDSIAERARSGAVLNKKEEQLVSEVPLISESLIINIPRLKPVAEVVRYVNKNYDGTGAPTDQKKGEQIPLGARIVRGLKLFEKYKAHLGSAEKSISRLRMQAGMVDPRVVQAIETLFVLKQEAAKPETVVQEIGVRQLCVGQKLLADVKTNDGVLLITAGHEVTKLILGRILNYSETVGVQEPIAVDVLIPTV